MRVLTVLELLQSRGRMSGRDLAAHLEVSVRTVQRYVARLQDLGIPVAGTRGPGGFYRLQPGFRLPPLMFGTEEAFALALGLDALAHLGLSELAPAAASAQAKLARVLPVLVRERVEALRAALELEPPRWVVDADAAVLMELATAVHNQQRARLGYATRDGSVSERVVEPLGLMQHDGRWFLAAYCLLRRCLRLFRVDRVKATERLQGPFEPPPGFDLHAFLYESIAFAPSPWRVEVWLKNSPERIAPYLPRAKAVLSADGEGTRLRCGVADLEDFAVLLLHLGCELEVISPPELVGAFQAVAARAQAVGFRSA